MLQAEQILHDRYRLKQKLGQNAGRQTWLAEDIDPSPVEPVIVKLLAFGGDVQWDDLKLFEREAQILKQLDHPRIPKYRDYFNIDDRILWFGLVQEYLPGSSLKDLLDKGKRFTQADIRQIALGVLEVLIYLHELNPPVLHRDIKPSNLILGENDRIYVVDFGAVQDKAAIEGATFTVVGTYGYAPVEQFGGRAVPASDLYALGATLIHLLTGISPADLPQQNMQIQFADRVRVSPSMVDWLQKLCEPALERRFSTAREVLKVLKYGNPKTATTVENLQLSLHANNSGCGGLLDPLIPVPPEILGWNWGAFFLPGLWPFTNRVWAGLLSWMPWCGWIVSFILGAKGNEWAWKSRKWRSIEQFKAHQRGWAIAGIFLGIPVSLIIWLSAAALVAAML